MILSLNGIEGSIESSNSCWSAIAHRILLNDVLHSYFGYINFQRKTLFFLTNLQALSLKWEVCQDNAYNILFPVKQSEYIQPWYWNGSNIHWITTSTAQGTQKIIIKIKCTNLLWRNWLLISWSVWPNDNISICKGMKHILR